MLDGVRVRLPKGSTQVVTVNHTSGHHARVSFWARNRTGWVLRMQVTDGRIGYGGLVPGPRRRQGSGTTPLGTYRLPYAFGTQRERDGWDIRYRPIRRGDYWVQDNASKFYNRYRNKRQGGFRWWLPKSHPDSSERLLDFRRAVPAVGGHGLQPAARSGTAGPGSSCTSTAPGATAGCVSVPRPFLQRLMGKLDQARDPVIAVGR